MATIINMGGGSIYPVLLASLTSIPTSSTAVSGTENWKKYDAIYFDIKMHFTENNDFSSFTNLILTKNVGIGDRYGCLRQNTATGSGGEANIFCWFYNDQIKMSKKVYIYDIIRVNIYGVHF